jgi:carboxyl-terminal processing protease
MIKPLFMTENNNTKLQIRLPLLFAVTLAVGMFIGQKLPHSDHYWRFLPGNSASESAGAIDEVMRYIEARYVDSVQLDEIKTSAIDEMLKHLDPHSVYISPDELQAVEDDMSGGFEGIGIEFIMVHDTMQVVTPLTGGPSEAAGIMAGDRIISINDTTIAGTGIDNGKIYKKLRGKKGSTVKVGIQRGNEPTMRFFNITRDVIPVKSVEVAYMLDAHNGYVKINRFSAKTYTEFMEAIRPMVEEKGMQNLVLDLRGNPGGFLNEATELLSQFFPSGKLLVYTQGRTEARREYKSNGRARFNIQQIAVLIDEGSASASEIVAGAIQDHDRGWIIGRRSFGKGLVQEQYPLSDGGALRLTISRYYTPSGRSIQKAYKKNADYEHDTEERLKNGELNGSTKFKPADSTQYFTGQGRVVFAGGGISPDVFIPIDTTFANPAFFEARQMIPEFVADWMQKQPKTNFPADVASFLKQFQVSDALFAQFLDLVGKQKPLLKRAELQKSKTELCLHLKARIARSLFQDMGLYSVFNDDDPAVEKAVQLLNSAAPIK